MSKDTTMRRCASSPVDSLVRSRQCSDDPRAGVRDGVAREEAAAHGHTFFTSQLTRCLGCRSAAHAVSLCRIAPGTLEVAALDVETA